MDISRRNFLRGRPQRNSAPLRPPWSVEESLFTKLCTRCGDCIQHCESGILQKNDGGFPETYFHSGGCSFCKKCVQACKPRALNIINGATPWLLKAVIGSSCLVQQKVICRTCGESCDAGAINFRLEKGGVATPQLNLVLCNGCGMCVADCPGHAIAIKQAEFSEEELV